MQRNDYYVTPECEELEVETNSSLLQNSPGGEMGEGGEV